MKIDLNNIGGKKSFLKNRIQKYQQFRVLQITNVQKQADKIYVEKI